MEIKKVGVLGCGLMGSGIAQTAAMAGFETTVREVSDDLIQKGWTRARGFTWQKTAALTAEVYKALF